MKPRVLVITGDGINCERETAHAFRLANFETDVRHLNDLIREELSMDGLVARYACVALPGGFSFGDDIASGRVLALKIRHGLRWDFTEYAERGGLVIGICNGFQALIRLGVFHKKISITRNDSGKFQNQWIRARVANDHCVWLRGISAIDLPIRHGEGRIVADVERETDVIRELKRQKKDCLVYDDNPNGSIDSLAGLCDTTGRILGLMPHPEAFVRWTAHPEWTKLKDKSSEFGGGITLFRNAYDAATGGLEERDA